jgi:hypothetical protein
MARLPGGSCAEARTAIEPAPVPQGHLRVLVAGELSRPILAETVALAPCRSFELGLVCGDADRIAAFAPLDRAAFRLPALQPDRPMAFHHGAAGTALLRRGWSRPEPWGVWSDGPRAELDLIPPEGWHGGARIAIEAHGFVAEGRDRQRVTIQAGGAAIAALDVGPRAKFELTVPASAIRDGRTRLVLLVPGAISPRVLDRASLDNRRLGIGLIGVTQLRTP